MILLYSTDNGHVPPWVYLPVASGANIGTGVAWQGDELLPSSDPTHVCVEPPAEGNLAACVEITEHQIWAIDSDIDFTPGVGMTVSSDGERLDGLGDTFFPFAGANGVVYGRFTDSAEVSPIPIAIVGLAVVGRSKTGKKV